MTDKSQFTFLAAVRAGRASPSQANDWIDAWHTVGLDGQDTVELHDFLGMTWEQYGRWTKDSSALAAIIAESGEGQATADLDLGPFKISYGIPAPAQESSFANACLSSVKDGMSMSVAVTPPADFDVTDPQVVNSMLRAAFRRLVDTGWMVEIQIGPDTDSLSEADRKVIAGQLRRFVEAAR